MGKCIELYLGKDVGSEIVPVDKLVENHYFFVEQIANKIYVANGVGDFPDLIEDGRSGLLDAAWKYDVDKSVLFKTYAEHRIKGAILDGLRERDPLSRYARKKIKLFNEAYAVMAHELGRCPDRDEIIGELSKGRYVYDDFKAKGVNKAEKIFRDVEERGRFYSIDPIGGGTFLGEEVFYPAIDGAERNFGLGFEGILDGVSEREKSVLMLKYVEEKTNKEIGKVLGVGADRVSQIHTEARGRLKRGFEEKGLGLEEALGVFCD